MPSLSSHFGSNVSRDHEKALLCSLAKRTLVSWKIRGCLDISQELFHEKNIYFEIQGLSKDFARMFKDFASFVRNLGTPFTVIIIHLCKKMLLVDWCFKILFNSVQDL